MPILITCIEGGCISEKNGGKKCSGRCSASDFRQRRADSEPQIHQKILNIQNRVSKLPDKTKKIIEYMAKKYAEGQFLKIGEIANQMDLDATEVGAAMFDFKRLATEAMRD